MHGGVNDAIGYIPGTEQYVKPGIPNEKYATVDAWIKYLKEFKDKQLKEFDEEKVNDSNKDNVCLNSKNRKAQQLIDLGVPGGNEGHTVI